MIIVGNDGNTFASGRLAKDPELRVTQSGISVCSFSLVVDKVSVSDAENPNGKNQNVYLNCTAWRELGESIAKLREKEILFVMGKTREEEYNGKKYKKCEVDFVTKSFLGSDNLTASTVLEPTTQNGFLDVSVEDSTDLPF